MSQQPKPSIRLLIDNLPFVKVVDLMLLEGTPATDVAKVIQLDQKALVDVHTPSLVNALLRRKDRIRKAALEKSGEDTKRWFGTADDDIDDEGEDEGPDGVEGTVGRLPGDVGEFKHLLPSTIARNLYERVVENNVDELVETEALYMAQRARIDRLIEKEMQANGYIDTLQKEIGVAMNLLVNRVKMKEVMGLTTGDAKFREQLDLKGYTDKTVKTLSNPESRHRVINLMDRLAKVEQKKLAREAEEAAKKTG